jgi:hypothetical protein
MQDVPADALVVGAVVVERIGEQDLGRFPGLGRAGQALLAAAAGDDLPEQDEQGQPMAGGSTARKTLPADSSRAWPRSVWKKGVGLGCAGVSTGAALAGTVSGWLMMSFRLLSLMVTALMADSCVFRRAG